MLNDSSASELPISLRGRLLLATPSLSDGMFDHAVILLSQHSAEEGAFGTIINHPTKATVSDLLPEMEASSLGEIPIHRGGPLSPDSLTFSSFLWDSEGKLSFSPQISVEQAKAAIENNNQIVQATLGYSAWSPGQLESELVRNTWITRKPAATLLSQPHDRALWKKLLTEISPYHDLLSQAPKNPLFN
ncbi:MAG: YqgE/AlgH family protein [Akkermansiaceae bacterium]